MAGLGRRAIIIASLSFFLLKPPRVPFCWGNSPLAPPFLFCTAFFLGPTMKTNQIMKNGPVRRCPNHQNKNADLKWKAI